MEKTIKIDGRDVKFKTTADTIRLYRQRFGRDLLLDFNQIYKEANGGETWSAEAQETLEDFAYIAAKQADATVPDEPGEWLDSFEMLSIYLAWPQLVELWTASSTTTSESKKKE